MALLDAATSANEVKGLIDLIFPVGIILEFDHQMDLNKVYGGKWELYGEGRVTVGVDINQSAFAQVNKTGGEAAHILTVGEMPMHAHAQVGVNSRAGEAEDNGKYPVQIAADLKHNWTIPPDLMYGAGNNQPHNNLQPYITVYRYRKIAN